MSKMIPFFLGFCLLFICATVADAQCTNTTIYPNSQINGEANSGGNICDVTNFTVSMKGVCWAVSPATPIIGTTGTIVTQNGSGSGSFSARMTGLTPGTNITVRSYALLEQTLFAKENTPLTVGIKMLKDTVYGPLKPYTVPYITPDITSFFVYTSGVGTAVATGRLNQKGQSAVTKLGVCWSTSPNPTLNLSTKREILAPLPGFNLNKYSFTMNNLLLNTTYYVRMYAANSAGVAYGEQVIYKIKNTIQDAHGKYYGTIQIGEQEWMRENLKTTKYNTGEPIPSFGWVSYKEGSPQNITPADLDTNFYGYLYKWYVVNNTKGICPSGWHVPSDTEWQTLEASLGMPSSELTSTGYRGATNNVGGQMKEVSVSWQLPNAGATNSSGFSALPGGMMNDLSSGGYTFGIYAYFWTSTEKPASSTTRSEYAWNRFLRNNTENGKMILRTHSPKNYNLAVRCVKD